MTVRYSITEARARFAELLRRVEGGETVVVTRRGRAVAHVVPVQETGREDYARAVTRFRRRLKELEPIDMSLEEMMKARHEGHRF